MMKRPEKGLCLLLLLVVMLTACTAVAESITPAVNHLWGR